MQRSPTPHDWGPDEDERPRRSQLIVALALAVIVLLASTSILGYELLTARPTPAVQPPQILTVRMSGIIDATNVTNRSGGYVAFGVTVWFGAGNFENPEDQVIFWGVNGVPNLEYHKTFYLDAGGNASMTIDIASGDAFGEFHPDFSHQWSDIWISFRLWRSAGPTYGPGEWQMASTLSHAP